MVKELFGEKKKDTAELARGRKNLEKREK